MQTGANIPFQLPELIELQVRNAMQDALESRGNRVTPQQTGLKVWAVSQTEKLQYGQIFKMWDPNNSGFISGIYNFFLNKPRGARASNIHAIGVVAAHLIAHLEFIRLAFER